MILTSKPTKENIGVDWPVRYKDIAPWYDKVEEYIGVSGEKLGLSHLPDGKFHPPMDLMCPEEDLKNALSEEFDDGRLADHWACGKYY